MSTAIAQESILGTRVNATSYLHAAIAVCEWAGRRESKYVCIASVNNVMEAYDSQAFQLVMNQADLVTPDGMPLVWGLRLLGQGSATRVYGPDLTPIVSRAPLRRKYRSAFTVGRPRFFRSSSRWYAGVSERPR